VLRFALHILGGGGVVSSIRTPGTPLVVVSSDTHVGPLLKEQLRPYCPRGYLERFDEEVRRAELAKQTVFAQEGLEAGFGMKPRAALGVEDDTEDEWGPQRALTAPLLAQGMPNLATQGHFDVRARLRDMDADGVAAEVIFHASQNWEPMPFVGGAGIPGNYELGQEPELAAVGQHIYNQWLADMVSVEPARHVGLAQLPMWDPDAALAELEWAAAAGLRGVNFPMPRPDIPRYDEPVWERFWAACADLGMVLTTHAGGQQPDRVTSHTMAIWLFEAGWLGRRALPWMIYSGVFERHPGLKLVLTEQIGEWWSFYEDTLDLYGMTTAPLSKRPSEYLHSNVFVGASFLANFEAVKAVNEGYAANLMWGSDYPHGEGTYRYPAKDGDEPVTHLALRCTFAGVTHPSPPFEGLPDPVTAPVAPEQIPGIVGANAVRVYGLDADELSAVAARINAPTIEELTTPIASVPEDPGLLAFRFYGPMF
jgi:predicted TIM-barrel fold metal-dependent hydrolase